VYTKNYTDLYLDADSAYNLAKKRVVPSTLIHCAQTICDDSLQEEIQHLKQPFKKNGYTVGTFNKPYTPRTTLRQQMKNLMGLPDFHTSTSHPI